MTPGKEFSLLGQQFITPFVALDNNFSVVGIDLRYERSAGLTIVNYKKPATLKFELLNDKKELLFASTRHAYVVEGSPRFQFGFPTIESSKNKKYFVRLYLLNGKIESYLLLN